MYFCFKSVYAMHLSVKANMFWPRSATGKHVLHIDAMKMPSRVKLKITTLWNSYG